MKLRNCKICQLQSSCSKLNQSKECANYIGPYLDVYLPCLPGDTIYLIVNDNVEIGRVDSIEHDGSQLCAYCSYWTKKPSGCFAEVDVYGVFNISIFTTESAAYTAVNENASKGVNCNVRFL